MKNYRFKHESVLNYRSQIEDEIKREFAELLNSLSTERGRLAEFEVIHERKASEMLAKKTFTPNEVDIYRGYQQFLKVQIVECEESIDSITGEINKKREELMEASKDKKILEVIKDKGRVDYIKAEAKSEQDVSDEFNINKFSK